MKITYRKLIPDESGQYREIRLESLKLHPDSFGSSFEEQSKLPKLRLQEAIEQPDSNAFVIGAFDRQLLVGICGFLPFFAGMNLDMTNTGLIIQVYVKPAYRGNQIGLGLINATLDEAFRQSDIDQVILGVWEGNIPAIRVYQQAGFEMLSLKGSHQTAGKSSGTHYMIIRRNTVNRERADQRRFL